MDFDIFKVKEIRGDEHADENGFPVCNNCGQPRYCVLDENTIVRAVCKCQSEERDKKAREQELAQLKDKIATKRQQSLLGKRYADATFETADINSQNEKAYGIARSYAEKYKDMLDKGYGFYVYGAMGTGKTHLTACVCNYLTDHLQNCIFTNFMNIMNDIRRAYGNVSPISPDGVIDKYSNIPFLFIDDLGKESYKKLSGDVGWLDEQLFNILNNRYNNMLPTIFSSNYAIDELSSTFGFDPALVDRISAMATRTIHLQGRTDGIQKNKIGIKEAT